MTREERGIAELVYEIKVCGASIQHQDDRERFQRLGYTTLQMGVADDIASTGRNVAYVNLLLSIYADLYP